MECQMGRVCTICPPVPPVQVSRGKPEPEMLFMSRYEKFPNSGSCSLASASSAAPSPSHLLPFISTLILCLNPAILGNRNDLLLKNAIFIHFYKL